MLEPANRILSPVASALKRLALLPRSFRLRATVWRPPPASGGQDVTVAYIGEGESYRYLRFLYGRGQAAASPSRLPLLALPNALAKVTAQGTVALVEVNRLLARLLPPRSFLTYPWLKQVV